MDMMDHRLKALESRLREAERHLDYEKKQNMDYVKQMYKKDRKIKELVIEVDSLKERTKELETLAQDAESELKIYRRRFEEAQEVSHMNASRFRSVHQKYLDECGKMAEFEEKVRRRRAVLQNTPFFVQA